MGMIFVSRENLFEIPSLSSPSSSSLLGLTGGGVALGNGRSLGDDDLDRLGDEEASGDVISTISLGVLGDRDLDPKNQLSFFLPGTGASLLLLLLGVMSEWRLDLSVDVLGLPLVVGIAVSDWTDWVRGSSVDEMKSSCSRSSNSHFFNSSSTSVLSFPLNRFAKLNRSQE